jgi:hypothetical protein
VVRAGRYAVGAVTVVATVAGGGESSAFASHGGAVTGIVIDFEGLRPVRIAPDAEGCVVNGVVHNGAAWSVSVRVRYRGQAAGEPIVAAEVRVRAVQPGETREFTSSVFSAPEGGAPAPCAAIRQIEMIEAVADPQP